MPNKYSKNKVSSIDQHCIQCNQVFHSYRLRSFCCHPCYWQALKTLPLLTCEICSKIYDPHSMRQKTCSIKCNSVYKSKENHPNWKARARSLLSEIANQDLDDALVTTLGLEKDVNAFFRLHSPSVIARLRESFPDLPDVVDARLVFIKLRELRNSW